MATNYRDMPGWMVADCEKTVRRLLQDVGCVAGAVQNHALVEFHSSEEKEWEWEDAGKLSRALYALKDVCKTLGIEYTEY